MKTIKVISLLFTIFLIGSILSMNVYAKNPVKEYPEHAKQVKKVLEQTVKFPDCGMKKAGHGEAEVIFSIADDGKIMIDSVSANCKELEVYIREKLTGLCFKGLIHPYNQRYKVKFTFLYC